MSPSVYTWAPPIVPQSFSFDVPLGYDTLLRWARGTPSPSRCVISPVVLGDILSRLGPILSSTIGPGPGALEVVLLAGSWINTSVSGDPLRIRPRY